MTEIIENPRRNWMGVLAKAAPARLAALMPDLPPHALLRGPETGTVMMRGRTGATGSPFNLGEMTVTRCSVRLEDGTVGHAWVQGRDKDHARRAALGDALMQGSNSATFETVLIRPLRDEAEQRREERAAKAAATRVEFFTLVRGEDK